MTYRPFRPAGSRASVLLVVALLAGALLAGVGCAGEPADPRALAFAREMQAAYDRGDLRAAQALADSADRYTPALPDVDYTRGLIANRLRRYAEARQAFGRVLERDPSYRGAWYNLGHTAFLERKFREAIGHYEQEQAVVSRLLARGGEAAAALDPQALPTITAQIGRAYDRMGVPDSARIAYEAALAADSNLVVAHAWLSELYEQQGRVDEAFHHARKALHGNPQDTEYTYRLGSLYLQKGHPEAAAPILSVVVKRWPGHEGASYNLGRALVALGKQEEGQYFLDRVEALQRLHEETLVAERGVETYPREPQRWITLAGLMLQSGYLDRAEEAFQAALSLQPHDRTVQNDLANLALVRGDTTAAIARFEGMLRQDPTFASGWLNLGIVYAMTGRRDDARAAWQQTLRYQPDDAQARAYLARLEDDGHPSPR